jgi:hypothetical protein
MAEAAKGQGGFEVARWVDLLGGFISRRPKLWIGIGNLETRLLADELETVGIEQPIYVTGLARSGSTKLLEMLAAHPDTVSHRYSDYPPIFTPYLWNRLLERMPKREAAAVERTHKDGIKITPDSPEAFEEVLWMAFFPQLHRADASEVLDAATVNPGFEAFYRAHIKKLLRVRGGTRYLAKGNYNLTRLEYLLKLFPDARFVVPVRDPVWHIASLMKQHALFSEGEGQNPKALEHMRRVGHFEFGLDRRPVHVGDDAALHSVSAAWAAGQEVLGWAHHWRALHAFLMDRIETSAALARAVLLVRFEDLCRDPRATLGQLLEHCALEAKDAWLHDQAADFHLPAYYRPRFSDGELETIRRITGPTAARLGYAERDLAILPAE